MARVLLVDDELALIQLSKEYLESGGEIQVDWALSPEEALSKLGGDSYDAVVSDYQLGHSNGIELLKTIRSSGNDVPFILFTGRGREEVAVEALNHGADFYVRKGGSPDAQFAVLSSMVIQAARRKEAERALVAEEERYRTIFENTGTAMAIIEEDTTLSLVNGGFVSITGVPREEIEGKLSWTEFANPVDLPRMKGYHHLRRVDPKAAPHNYESDLVDRSGRIHHVMITIGMIPGSRRSVGSIIDISDKRQVEERLRESEGRLRLITDNMLELVSLVDAELAFNYVSPSHEDTLGYKPEEMFGRSLIDFIHPDDLGRVAEMISVAIADKKGGSAEMRFRHAGGRYLWMEVFWTFLFGKEGGLEGGVITGRDITEGKNSEAVRSAMYRISRAASSGTTLQELYRTVHSILSEFIPVENFYIAILDPLASELSFPYFVDWMDEPPPPRKLGKGLTEFVIRTGKPLLASLNEIQEMRDRGEVELIGSAPVDWMGVPLRAEGRTIGAMVAQIYDEGIRYTQKELEMLAFVSDQVAMAVDHLRAEEEIGEANKKIAHLASFPSLNPNPVLEVGLSGDLIFCNDSALEVLEKIGADDPRLFLPTDIETLLAELRKGGSGSAYREVRVKDLVFREDISLNQRSRSLRIYAKDITEKRMMEGEIQLANRKLALLEDITRHDLMNQLTTVYGYLELVKAHTTDSRALEYLKRTEHVGRNIERIIASTREYSRMGSDKPIWLSTRESFERGVSTLDASAVRIDLRLDHVEIRADPMLEKVFHNLVDNSLRHGGGVRNISIGAERCDDGLLICYEDDGVGIPDEKKASMFRGRRGRGLCMVKEILGITGISIRENGTSGKGARFEIQVPMGHFKMNGHKI